MKQIQYKGHFWLPKSKRFTYGFLKWHNNIAYLELLSNPGSDDPNKHNFRVDILFGILNGQSAVTIVNCTFRTLSFPYCDYIVNFEYLVYGHGSNWNSKPVNLNHFRFTYDHLFKWSNIRAIKSQGSGKKVKIVRGLENFKSKLYEGKDFDLAIGYVTNFDIITHKSTYQASQETYFELYDKLNLNFTEVFEKIYKLTTLLRLLTSAKFSYKSIITARDHKKIEYFLIVNKISDLIKDEEEINNDFLIKYENIIEDDSFSKVINSYFCLNNITYENIKLLTTCIEDHLSPRHFIFLNLIYTLDKVSILDGKAYSVTKLTSSDEKHLNILIKSKVPKNTIEYFKSKIKRTNYTKLKERIGLYLLSFSFISNSQSVEEIENFVELIVNTRNDLSHGTKRTPIIETNGFQNINEILLNWVSLIILKELGLDDKLLAESKLPYSS